MIAIASQQQGINILMENRKVKAKDNEKKWTEEYGRSISREVLGYIERGTFKVVKLD